MSARRIRYSVAMSLDGFIADRDGGYDWIVDEPAIDFAAYMAKIDTLVMGRGTFETALEAPGGLDSFSAMDIYVVSTTLAPDDHPEVTIVSSEVERTVRALKAGVADAGEGRGDVTPAGGGDPSDDPKDIWLFGGGVLFRSLLEAGLVDRVEVGVVPVLLGEGIPLLPGLGRAPAGRASAARRPPGGKDARDQEIPVAGLRLHSCETFDSGIVLLKYDVLP